MERKKTPMWCNCLLIITFMTLVSYLWKDFCNNWYFNGAHCFFLENRVHDIINVTSCVFWEEAIFRFLPFLTATILILQIKQKWLKHIMYIVFCIIIICIQLQFGALHYNIITDTSYKRPIIIHGVQGLILMATYAITLLATLDTKKETENQKRNNNIKQVLIANFIAYLNSVAVHAASNMLLVLTQTF